MSKFCRSCGLDGRNCVCGFTHVEEQIKQELKERYHSLAGNRSSKQGLANYIWRNYLRTLALVEQAKKSEEKAWQEKTQSVKEIAVNNKKQYETRLNKMQAEIDRLTRQLERARAASFTKTQPAASQGSGRMLKDCVCGGRNENCNFCGGRGTYEVDSSGKRC